MERLILSAPAMYADHHVLKVREELFALNGIEDVYASSAWHTVIVPYDPERLAQADIETTMAEAGYGPESATPVLAEWGKRFQDPAWKALGARVTQTNEADLRMSGEFRRY
jgi:copper chaperone CopZ